MRRPARRVLTHGRRALAFWADAVRSLYERPLGWIALVVSSAFLTYVGGAVMFWFHAIVRGEHGPAIDHVHHWLLDATLGFVALTPVLAVILPVAVWLAGAARSPRARVRLPVYVLGVAVLFTLTTGPGPLLHNVVAGAGTPLADLATRLFGQNLGMVGPRHARPLPVSAHRGTPPARRRPPRLHRVHVDLAPRRPAGEPRHPSGRSPGRRRRRRGRVIPASANGSSDW